MSNNTVYLRVSFDVDQLSSALVWQATEGTDQRSAYHRVGRYAGALHFYQNDRFTVELLAFAPLGAVRTITVIGASIITIPHAEERRRSAPSPFDSKHAVVELLDWAKAEEVADPNLERTAFMTRTESPLVVEQLSGRWELSLVVTVLIEFQNDRSPTRRVFSFDPESEVGTGGDPP
ncbi:hypothetical protein C7S18_17650 [Ahniella affigens]|uniref:Uncharacterized protein n=1 Tax=Ahniella affigens TaxID=2021234 RepID=A0A2P1PVN9_9GAMM|nr:hypothetical protein [Ahniella affigens]AVP98890.1 hypothetical protein C7S18_17650 [Ahniella affigens]